MGEKLSAFTDGGVPAPTDFLVGASPTLPDLKYQVSNLVPGLVASGNVALYVATAGNGGSDSNPGTIGSPFLTVQKAVNVGASYNYQGVSTLAINIGAGTFVSATQINLPELINYPANKFATITGAGPASTTVRSSNGIGWLANGSTATWQIDQLNTDAFLYHFFAAQGAFILTPFGGSIAVSDSVHGNNLRVFNAADGGLIQSIASVDASALTKLNAFMYIGGTNYSAVEHNLGNVILPAAPLGGNFGWWLANFNFEALLNWNPGTVTNPGSWTGGRINITAGTTICTIDGTLASIPGSTLFDKYDSTCRINNLTTSLTTNITNPGYTPPSTLSSGTTNNYVLNYPNEFWRITANAANSTLTGIVVNIGGSGLGQSDGDKHLVVNIGSGTLTLNHQDAGSTKTNRFTNSTGAAIVLSAGQAADLLYDVNAANGTDNTGAWLVFKRN